MRSRRRRGVGAAIGLACAVAAAGCTTQQGYLTVAATQPFQIDLKMLGDVDTEKLPVKHGIEGSHTAVTNVLFVPTLAGPRLEAAVDEAIWLGHGDILTRATVRTTKWWFLVGVETLTVRGSVVDLPETP
jgi:hypothetical protein